MSFVGTELFIQGGFIIKLAKLKPKGKKWAPSTKVGAGSLLGSEVKFSTLGCLFLAAVTVRNSDNEERPNRPAQARMIWAFSKDQCINLGVMAPTII